MRLALAAVALMIAVGPTFAASTDVAVQLGSVLAAEQFCGLTYDQAAIRSYIESHVKSDDMSFPSMLQMMTDGSDVQNKELSPSGKTAHCVQVARIAKSYGFTK